MNILKVLPVLIGFLFLTLIIPVKTNAAPDQKTLIQQIEILKHEISVLKSLIFYSASKQGINAGSYIAVDLSSNSAVMEKNSGQAYPIASITKLMNAVIALENVDLDKKITLTEKMLEPYGASPSLFANLNISARNLLSASLIQSANDASESLAYFVEKEKFLDLMNKKAKELGMANTVFYDTHGLNPLNASTASDLAKLVAYIYKQHPDILKITKNNDFWLPSPEGRALKFQNLNNFYPLSDFVGGKVGYLPEAKQTIASVFQVNGKHVAIVLLYSQNRIPDMFNILAQLKTKI